MNSQPTKQLDVLGILIGAKEYIRLRLFPGLGKQDLAKDPYMLNQLIADLLNNTDELIPDCILRFNTLNGICYVSPKTLIQIATQEWNRHKIKSDIVPVEPSENDPIFTAKGLFTNRHGNALLNQYQITINPNAFHSPDQLIRDLSEALVQIGMYTKYQRYNPDIKTSVLFEEHANLAEGKQFTAVLPQLFTCLEGELDENNRYPIWDDERVFWETIDVNESYPV